MKKILLLCASAFFAISMNAQETVTFDSYLSSSPFTTDVTAGSFTFKATSSYNWTIDSNSAYFYDGTPTSIDQCTQYSTRAKPGGKSSSTYRFITFSPTGAGTLKIAARTGSNNDATRTMVITLDETEIFNKTVKEADATTVTNPSSNTGSSSVYPYYTVNVATAGTVNITFPINAINIYSIIWTPNSTSGVSSSTADADKTVASTKYYDITGREVTATTTGLILKKITYTDGTTSVEKSLVKK